DNVMRVLMNGDEALILCHAAVLEDFITEKVHKISGNIDFHLFYEEDAAEVKTTAKGKKKSTKPSRTYGNDAMALRIKERMAKLFDSSKPDPIWDDAAQMNANWKSWLKF